MRPRILKTKLDLHGQPIRDAAAGIGIAENTLRTLLRDDWEQLGRETIERVCDTYSIGIAQLFELKDSAFWDQLIKAGEYSIIRDAKLAVQPFDQAARAKVTGYLTSRFPAVTGKFKDDLHEPNAVIDFVKNNNAIIVGSARRNRATEITICKHFGAQPFSSDPKEKQKIPFRFIFDSSSPLESTLSEPQPPRPTDAKVVGIFDETARRPLIKTTWLPEHVFLDKTIEQGHDCALVLVINKPFGTKRNVKLIVLAGLTGIGTLAAAAALVRDHRDLEPGPAVRETIGVLEANFKKTRSGEDNRVLTGTPRWRYLRGGRKLVLPKYPNDQRPTRRQR